MIGHGDGENFLASNLSAFLSETRRVSYPGHGDIVEVTPQGVRVIRAEDGSPVELEEVRIDWDEEVAERDGYETFMLKEIYEQPEGFDVTIGDRVRHGILVQDGLGLERGRAPRAPPDRDRRVRHLLPRGRRRPLRDRGVGPRAGRAGHRERVDLPQPRHRRGHPRDRHLPVGRDTRHDPGDEARARAGRPHRRDHEPDGLADHPRGRLRRSSRAPASRSASPPRRPSPRRPASCT